MKIKGFQFMAFFGHKKNIAKNASSMATHRVLAPGLQMYVCIVCERKVVHIYH